MQLSLLAGEPNMATSASQVSQLQSADPMQWPVDLAWSDVKTTFFNSAAGQSLLNFLSSRLASGAVVFPPEPLRALALTPPSSVRVVILGQDPYHGRCQGEGLAFSVAQGVKIPPSLRNIFKEVAREGVEAQSLFPITAGSLLSWSAKGVLLLNTCLTVEEGLPASHAGRGWEALTDDVIRAVSAQPHPVVFMLWGAHAQSKRPLVDQTRHLVLTANHPSPLSASRAPLPFLGCGHFSSAAAWLGANR